MQYTVIVHASSKRFLIRKDANGNLHMFVLEPARDNQANKAVIKALAEYFNLPKSHLRIIYGEKTKTKVVEIG